MIKNKTIDVNGVFVSISRKDGDDYICLTDIANAKDSDSRAADIIKNWIRNRGTLEFIGTWEQLYNPNFKVVEFDHFKMQAGLPSFVLSPGKWVEQTEAIGIFVKSGRYGGTYAHKDIAFEFCSAISPIFKLYLIKEFQRLKEEEQKQIGWDLQRTLSKINYKIHTDAIKLNLIPAKLPKRKIGAVYASEADLLNTALFGVSAKEWRAENLGEKGNVRDHATLEQLVVLSNLESINSMLVHQGLSQSERLIQLNKMAITQMSSLLAIGDVRKRLN
ncbi:MAG: KilA-N domain-containing protein [Lentisphaeria bacterium]|nr:KilA-N domain-containing protein [Lentisphaeria bacterium]